MKYSISLEDFLKHKTFATPEDSNYAWHLDYIKYLREKIIVWQENINLSKKQATELVTTEYMLNLFHAFYHKEDKDSIVIYGSCEAIGYFYNLLGHETFEKYFNETLTRFNENYIKGDK